MTDPGDEGASTSGSSSFLGQHLEIDTDSAYGDDSESVLSAFTSAMSAATDYRYENGRRYHAYDDGAYYLPNDEDELDRLDLQHEMWKMVLKGALYMSPIPDSVQSVLDVGCGTGVWSIQFAEEHPGAQVIGTDLSPVQPSFVPPNCSFLVDNAEKEWAFDQKFDFVHVRMLCMGMHSWPRFFRQCWENMEPGGWLEVREIMFPWGAAGHGPQDLEQIAKSPLLEWSDLVRQGAAKVGIDTKACLRFEELLRGQGFVNVRRKDVQWPLGIWPKGEEQKKLGAYAVENLKSGLQGISTAVFSRNLGMSREEIEVRLAHARKDLKEGRYYAPIFMYSCQKPDVQKASAEPAFEARTISDAPASGKHSDNGKDQEPESNGRRMPQ
ncbi:uncharacterized protein K452DRAFT_293995 [Aplosporella prunicola CBS 121167]|uniref:Methyltransferase domain-containing protein n=1 Tax=Aplosporella prunicola CBS 121167 TaxID=1176127 RepID=A0A6A6BXI1_9PEZI|nr:uncharacterized protein K452DRAFT_293995 [Aplosporella prunicola CBS 121167]KAF2147597.1 hypothetical protein K452DRAFT_293995 [Aplosporella prunicola CBS 121167]